MGAVVVQRGGVSGGCGVVVLGLLGESPSWPPEKVVVACAPVGGRWGSHPAGRQGSKGSCVILLWSYLPSVMVIGRVVVVVGRSVYSSAV